MAAFYERREKLFDLFTGHNLSFIPHIHSHTELVFALEGTLEMTIGECTQTLHPGEMAIVFPNTVHSHYTPEQSEAKLIIFHGDLVPEYTHRLTHYRPVLPFLEASFIHKDVLAAFHALEDEGLSLPLRKAYLGVLLGRLLEMLPTQKRPAPEGEDLLHKLLLYLDENYRQPLSLESLAAALHVSRYRVSRCFSGQIGCTYNDYINTLRTGYAAELLENAELSASQAGFEAGFDSLCTFYRAFKQRYGLSPKAYMTKQRLHS